jgi:hypothetical protein
VVVEIQDDPMWYPAEMVANRREVTKRELYVLIDAVWGQIEERRRRDGKPSATNDEKNGRGNHG